MAHVDHHIPGTFCWNELATTEPAAAKAFYGALLGWSTRDAPMGDDNVYTFLNLGESPVAALYGMHPHQRQQGVQPHWLCYVAVNDIDAVAARATALGGTIVLEPFDVGDVGRMAVLVDPTGATVALWQARAHIGSHLLDEPGASCWHELATNDRAAAERFYSALFEWRPDTQIINGTFYTTFYRGSMPAAGLLTMTEEWGDMAPHWMVYFQVKAADDVVQRATELGGGIHVPATDIPPVGRFAVIGDPQQATFSILQPLDI